MSAPDTPVSEAAPEPSAYISVIDVDGSGLVHAMVQLLKLPLVSALPLESTTLTFKQSYENWPRAIEDVFNRAQLKGKLQNGIITMRPACSQVALSAKGPAPSERVFLNFQRLPLSELLARLKLTPVVASKDQEAYEHAVLTISVWDFDAGDVLQSAASATGFRWAADSQGGWRLERETSDDCAFREQLPQAQKPRAIQSYPKDYGARGISDYCPYRAPNAQTTRRCDLLELYALHTLQPNGYVTLKGRSFGLVRTPWGLTATVRPGDNLGRDYGKLMGFDANGLDVREIIQDEDEEWVEKQRILQYGKLPKPTQSIRHRRSYLASGSPQDVYDETVSALLLYTQGLESAVHLCRKAHPGVTDGQQAALEAWQARNSNAINKVTQHSQAYVQRSALDIAIEEKYLVNALQENADNSTAVRFKIAGDLGSQDVRSICAAQSQLLQDPKTDLAARFSNELKALEQCTAERTCLNLSDK